MTNQVWYVQGDEDRLFFTDKPSAEVHARHLFPDESPDARYARIYYREVYKYVAGKLVEGEVK